MRAEPRADVHSDDIVGSGTLCMRPRRILLGPKSLNTSFGLLRYSPISWAFHLGRWHIIANISSRKAERIKRTLVQSTSITAAWTWFLILVAKAAEPVLVASVLYA